MCTPSTLVTRKQNELPSCLIGLRTLGTLYLCFKYRSRKEFEVINSGKKCAMLSHLSLVVIRLGIQLMSLILLKYKNLEQISIPVNKQYGSQGKGKNAQTIVADAHIVMCRTATDG